MTHNLDGDCSSDEEVAQRRHAMLFKLLKTPPQPRPKREQDKSTSLKRKKPNKKTPEK